MCAISAFASLACVLRHVRLFRMRDQPIEPADLRFAGDDGLAVGSAGEEPLACRQVEAGLDFRLAPVALQAPLDEDGPHVLREEGQTLGHLPGMVGRHRFRSFARGDNTVFSPRCRQDGQSQKQNSPTAQVTQHASSLDGSVNFGMLYLTNPSAAGKIGAYPETSHAQKEPADWNRRRSQRGHSSAPLRDENQARAFVEAMLAQRSRLSSL